MREDLQGRTGGTSVREAELEAPVLTRAPGARWDEFVVEEVKSQGVVEKP
jgi:hypothetical protein